MAKAIFEKRQFIDRSTGNITQYDYYGIVAIVDGEKMELPLKNLNGAEKLAFKIIAAGESPVNGGKIETRKINEEEENTFLKQNAKENNELDLFD